MRPAASRWPRSPDNVFLPEVPTVTGQGVKAVDSASFLGWFGLWGVDASRMPDIVKGNTASPTIMVAEKGAVMLPDQAAPVAA